jgi:RNA polymerase sigma factor (sigma-70 family)
MVQWYSGNLNRETTMAQSNHAHHETRTGSFAQLYEEHLSSVFRYISYRVGNQTVAEELTSAVFEKALNAFHRYQKEKAQPQTWLITIARNTVIDYFRKSLSRNNVPLESVIEVASADPPPQEEAERKEEYQRLRFCLETLSSREQEIVSFKFGAELTNRRIASVLDLSESNVGIILYRAIGKLRSCVKDWLNGKG